MEKRMHMYAYEMPWINMHAIANKPDGIYSIHNVVAICSAAFTHSLFSAAENSDKWGNCRCDDDDHDDDNNPLFLHQLSEIHIFTLA